MKDERLTDEIRADVVGVIVCALSKSKRLGIEFSKYLVRFGELYLAEVKYIVENGGIIK